MATHTAEYLDLIDRIIMWCGDRITRNLRIEARVVEVPPALVGKLEMLRDHGQPSLTSPAKAGGR